MAKPLSFSRPAKSKAAGSTAFNFGANVRPRKPRISGKPRKADKGGGS